MKPPQPTYYSRDPPSKDPTDSFSVYSPYPLSEYFSIVLLHILQSLRACFHFLLPLRRGKQGGGGNPHMTRHTEASHLSMACPSTPELGSVPPKPPPSLLSVTLLGELHLPRSEKPTQVLQRSRGEVGTSTMDPI